MFERRRKDAWFLKQLRCWATWVWLVTVLTFSSAAEEVSFRRDILPILADKCFHCHGPDAGNREAELRLDVRDEAVRLDADGHGTIVPGNPNISLLVQRIDATDPDVIMPPVDTGKPLTDQQKGLLRDWIRQGAHYSRHWSFELPYKTSLPDVSVEQVTRLSNPANKLGDWSIHPIDRFVMQRLLVEQLSPSPRADDHILLRRLAFDITGLPPTPSAMERLRDGFTEQEYLATVDELLGSPHHGERMAMWWLDVGRYADTDGYQGDATRTNWPWRDWVVQAFNRHMPYNQFTLEQFAGDLLPNATVDQVLATCFHRNHMTNGEGGRDPDESRIDYVIDRVNTVGTAWLGLTLGCCQCHSHKFDPISQHDYYSLFAYFNSIDEDGKAGGGAKPFLKFRSPFATRALEEAQGVVNRRRPIAERALKQAEKRFETWLSEQYQRVQSGFQGWHVLQPTQLETVAGTRLDHQRDGIVQASGPNPRQDDYRVSASTILGRVTGLKLEVLPHESHTEGKLSRGRSGEFILTDVKLQLKSQGASQLRDIELSGAVADVDKKAEARQYGAIKDTLDDDPRNGWTTAGADAKQIHFAIYALTEPLILNPGDQLLFVMFHRSTEGDANIGRFRLSVTDQAGSAVRSTAPMALEQLAAIADRQTEELDLNLRSRLFEQFLADDLEYQAANKSLKLAEDQLAECTKATEPMNVMVLGDRQENRQTHVLLRGVWNQLGDEVKPAVLGALAPEGDKGIAKPNHYAKLMVPATRLELANWLVADDNPLSGRVLVNHLWQMIFGAGLVRTTEDFGLQGQQPTHPELLDWLAVELVEHQWSVQHMIRLIVTSETYRQDSRVNARLLERDPENRLLARGSRYRLPSWVLRDAALAASGLLNPALGGPPVRPYQPDGVWEEMFMGRFHYEPSQGPAQYRRSLYAFWRRSIAPTYMFDSAQRRVCEVRVARTNTPLHALTILNDRTILDASLMLAAQAANRSHEPVEQIRFIFQRVLTRLPAQGEIDQLLDVHKHAVEHYRQHPKDAVALTQTNQFAMPPCDDLAMLAAGKITANLVFNLDEALSHE